MDDLKSLRESLDKLKIKLGIEEDKYKEAIKELESLNIKENDIDNEIKKAKTQKEENEIHDKLSEAEFILKK